MNYRHLYHAGNFADIIKHLTLIALLNCLLKKDKPFAVLDAFAGLGAYDLKSTQALKTAESENGINRLWGKVTNNSLISQFIDIISGCNIDPQETGNNLNLYPGSPWIINSLLRENDRLIACELHPQDYAHLRHLFRHHKDVAVHHLNAYNAIKAFLPFKENRGLILLDPPFEVKEEFDKLVQALKIINHRAASICSMIWYPIKDAKLIEKFHHDCQSLNFKETLKIEFELKSLQLQGLNKCGILITNPPFIFDQIKELLEYLKVNIYKDQANYKLVSI